MIRFRFMVLCAALLLFAAPDPAHSATREDIQAKVAAVIQAYHAANRDKEGFSAVSASVSLAAGESTIDAVTGHVSREQGAAPVTPQSLFQIGSITKSMTSVIVLQLVNEGVLSLDAPIGRWLPEYPDWKDLTLRRLLSMTSGIPGYDDTETFLKTLVAGLGNHHYSTAKLISFVDPDLAGAPPPTTGYNYSNSNFILAQMIIERATGESFEQQVRRRILTGHGLTDTFYSASIYPDAVASRMVSGYLAALAPEQKMLEVLYGRDTGHLDTSWAQAAGGAVATPSDLTRWARLLFTGPVLDEARRKDLTSLVSLKTGQPIAAVTKDDPKGFGLGVNTSTFGPDQTIWAYEGETIAARALYSYFPKHDLVIAVAVNSSTTSVDGIGRLLADIYVAVTGDTAAIAAAEAQPAN